LAASIGRIPEPVLTKKDGKVITPPPVELTVDITLGSTLAAAGLLSLFIDTDTTVAYDVSDLRPEDFKALTDAVEAALNDNFSFKPTRVLGDMDPYFRTLLAEEPVNKAYQKIVNYLAQLRQIRAGSKISTPAPASTTSPGASASPGSSASPSTSPGASTSPSASPSASVAPKTYDPIIVLKTELAAITVNTATTQMAVFDSLLGSKALVVPSDDKLVIIREDGTSPASLTAGQNGIPDFTEAFCLTYKDNKAFTVAKVAGAFNLITIDLANPQAPGFSAKALTGAAVVNPTSLAVSSAPSGATQGKLLMADSVQHTINTIDLVSGAVTVYSGTPTVSTGTEGTGLTQVFYNKPSSISLDETTHKLYVADTQKERIMEIDLVASTVKKLVGGALGVTSGTLADAKLNKPAGLWVGTADRMFVADTFNNAVRQLKIAEDEMVYLATSDQTAPNKGLSLVPFPKAITQFGAHVYVINSAGKVVKLDFGPQGS
jgi:hypothetical protein